MAEFVVNLKQERNAFAHNVGQAITVKSGFKDVFDHVKTEGLMLMVFVFVLLVILVLNVNQVILFIYFSFFLFIF